MQRAVAERQDRGEEERTPLYPFGQPQHPAAVFPAYRDLAISRAVGKVERVAGFNDTQSAVSAFGALAMARNYLNLSEYDKALPWYVRAAELDTGGSYAVDIDHESLASAVAQGDSLQVVQSLVNVLGNRNLAGRQAELILLLRHLLVQGDEENLALLVQKVSRLEEGWTGELRYWHAFALASLRSWTEALDQLRRLVSDQEQVAGLSERQRVWVATAVPDLLLLLGEPGEAGELYELLAGSSLPHLKVWGDFQLANLHLQAGRFMEAQLGFTGVCRNSEAGFWSEQACALAELATALDEIKTEGVRHGAVDKYGR